MKTIPTRTLNRIKAAEKAVADAKAAYATSPTHDNAFAIHGAEMEEIRIKFNAGYGEYASA